MTDVRALAAQGLAEVVFHGASLREVSARLQPRLADGRDRALLTALLNQGARWWLRFDAATRMLMTRPLPRREAAVQALLVLGLVQLEVMKLPPHAAVAATVDAVRALRKPRLAGLCNAVLRRWQREREGLLQRLDADACTRHACPRWLMEAICGDWPEPCDAILEAGNQPVAPMLRVNQRVVARDALIQKFSDAGIDAEIVDGLPDAIRLRTHTDITALPGFAEGAFSVQDGAAQLAADLLDLRDGLRVLDACAAPGGKTMHALERASLDLLAIDQDARRLQRLSQNLKRLGLDCALEAADAMQPAHWWDGRPFDRILLDAPCSATGVIRRHPDIKLHRRAGDIKPLADSQVALLQALWPLLATGGRLVYATCSLLRAENQAVIARFTTDRDDVRVVTPQMQLGRAAGAGWQLLPGLDGVDGMFYAVLEK